MNSRVSACHYNKSVTGSVRFVLSKGKSSFSVSPAVRGIFTVCSRNACNKESIECGASSSKYMSKKEETKSAVIVVRRRLNGGGVLSSLDPHSGPFCGIHFTPGSSTVLERCILRSGKTRVRGSLRSIDRISTRPSTRRKKKEKKTLASESERKGGGEREKERKRERESTCSPHAREFQRVATLRRRRISRAAYSLFLYLPLSLSFSSLSCLDFADVSSR